VNDCRFDDASRRMRARATFTVRRSDFAVGPPPLVPWWDVRRYLIDDEVRLVLDLEAVEQSEE
jgi:hypothetical protein